MTHITKQTLEQIKELRLNTIRCSLTGAPYATLDDSEILLTLQGDIANEPDISIDRLIDKWELRMLTISSQPAPILRNASRKSLTPLLLAGKDGNRRLLTYLLVRLLHPRIGTDIRDSETERTRMLFAKELHDALESQTLDDLATYVQQLSAVDSYCAMPHWHKLWVFTSGMSPVGIEKASKRVRASFARPDTILTNLETIRELITFLFNLMLYAGENDSVVGYSGNRLAQSLLAIDSTGAKIPNIPHFQKQLSPADEARIAKAKAVNANQATRIAWSATHGKGYLPTDDLLTRALKRQANKSATPKKTNKPKSKLQAAMADAFNQLLNERK